LQTHDSLVDFTGYFGQAVEFHSQHLTIAKESRDRVHEGRAYGNLGFAYQSMCISR
jgi:hypothetical protein